MNTPSISKYTVYCEGFGYLDKKRYADDVVQYRTLDRVLQSQLDQLKKALQERTALNNTQQAPASPTLPGFVRLPLNVLQRLATTIAHPFAAIANTLVSTAQSVQAAISGLVGRTLSGMEQVISKVFSFFFGVKRDNKDEQERREKDEYPVSDRFMRRIVEAAAGGGDSSNSR